MVGEEMGKVKISTTYKTLSQKKWGKGLKNRAKKTIDEIINWQLDWDSLLDKLSYLDKKSKPFQSALSKQGNIVHYARVENMRNLENVLAMIQFKFAEAFESTSKRGVMKDCRNLQKEVDLGTFKNSEGSPVHFVLTKGQILQKVMQFDDSNLKERKVFEEGMFFTDEIKEAFRNAVTPEEMAYIKGAKEVYQYMKGKISPKYEELYGVPFGDITDYSGYARTENDTDMDVSVATLMAGDDFRRASILNPSLKSRGKAKVRLQYDDITGSLMNYVMQMEHWLAWAEPLQELRSYFGDPRTKSIIGELYGKDMLRKIDGFLEDMTRDGVNRAKVIAPLDSIRFNFDRSVLIKPLKGVIMIKKIWKDLFYSSEAEGLSISSKEDTEEIIDILIADKIDPQFFISNLEALLLGGMPSFNDFLGTEEKPKTSKSISSFTFIANRPTGTPLWFLAGYPDVMNWFNDQQEKYIKSHNRDYDGWGVKMAKLFGINIEDGKLNENQIMDSKGKTRPKYLEKLIQSYKDVTEKALETAVKNIENDIYLGDEFLKAFGTENNSTFIAENTTKYYLELSRNYGGRFNDESSLLATAGILDARVYIFIEQSIQPSEIIKLAKKSISSNDPLLAFIIGLEIKLFKVDTTNIDIDNIKGVCEGQRQNIKKAIQKVKDEYTSEPLLASEVAAFMNSSKFKPYRKMLGIKNKFLFF